MASKTALSEWAENQAIALLSSLDDRWLHTQGVVERARQVGKALSEEDRSLLIAAAYLHDIGYAPALCTTGFHPLDGATYLLHQGQIRLASLVAYHSEAQHEAELRGLSTDLSKFPHEQSALTDALTYCDMLTGPTGQPISFEERIAEIFQRYGETHPVNRAIHEAIPSLTQAVKRTQYLLDHLNA